MLRRKNQWSILSGSLQTIQTVGILQNNSQYLVAGKIQSHYLGPRALFWIKFVEIILRCRSIKCILRIEQFLNFVIAIYGRNMRPLIGESIVTQHFITFVYEINNTGHFQTESNVRSFSGKWRKWFPNTAVGIEAGMDNGYYVEHRIKTCMVCIAFYALPFASFISDCLVFFMVPNTYM